MGYDNWTIGGVKPSWIEEVDYNHESREFTIHCVADKDRLQADPRTEITQFQEMSCDVINNTQLMNGGSCLQTCNGDPIIVSDGIDSWVGALKKVGYNADTQSKRLIRYDLVVGVETHGRPITYNITGTFDPDEPVEDPEPEIPITPAAPIKKAYGHPFCGLENIEYHRYSDRSGPGNFYGCQVIGVFILKGDKPIKEVEVHCQIYSPSSSVPNPYIKVRIGGGEFQQRSIHRHYPEVLTFTNPNPEVGDWVEIVSGDNTSEKNAYLASGYTIRLTLVVITYDSA